MIVYNGIPFTLAAGATSAQMFAPTAVPGNPIQQTTPAVIIGLRFRTTVAGQILGISFFKTANAEDLGHHVALYDDNGNRLAVTSQGSGIETETASGWQTFLFQAPVTIAANTYYHAARWSQQGYYASDPNVFTAPKTLGNFLLDANASSLKVLSSSGAFFWPGTGPAPANDPTNYYIDVLFVPLGGFTFLWTQTAGPATATLLNSASPTVTINAPSAGSYVFACAVGDGLVTNTQTKAVSVLPYFVSNQSYTASCGANTAGAPVTRTASYTSLVSQADADSNALAAAVTAANAALRCDPVQGFIGWRIVFPSLANFAGVANAVFSVQLRIAALISGIPSKPTAIAPIAAPVYTAGSPPNNLADLSSYFAAYPGAQTFYVWVQLTLVLNGVTTIVQVPSSAFSLDYATPVGTVTGATVRFRDVETAFTAYQGYASAYALTVANTNFSAVQMTLNLSNSWDTFSLNLHGWDDRAYGLKPGRGYDQLVLSVLTGTAAVPLRDTVLDVRSASYNLNDPYDFAANRLSYTPYFNGAQGTVTYLLRRARLLANGSLSYDPGETGFRFEASLNEQDYTSPGLSLPGATISPLAENDAGSITPGNNVAISFSPFPGNPVIAAYPVPRFTLSGFKWRLATDPYTYVLIAVIQGTPGAPTGIGNIYAFPMGEPAVLDGPNNRFLNLTEFDSLLSPTGFTPFSAVFYAATYNAASGSYSIFPNSFPLLNNPRTINGSVTYTVSNFAGFSTYPVAANSAVTFTGNFAYGETLYHARVNGGVAFSL